MNFEQYGELSAVMFDMTTALNSAINQLSSIPQHPYYATKEILFGKDYIVATLFRLYQTVIGIIMQTLKSIGQF